MVDSRGGESKSNKWEFSIPGSRTSSRSIPEEPRRPRSLGYDVSRFSFTFSSCLHHELPDSPKYSVMHHELSVLCDELPLGLSVIHDERRKLHPDALPRREFAAELRLRPPHCRDMSVDEIGYPKKSCGHYIVSIRHF